MQARWSRASVDLTLRALNGQVAQTARAGRFQHLGYRARRAGWYYVVLRITRHGFGRYALQLDKSK